METVNEAVTRWFDIDGVEVTEEEYKNLPADGRKPAAKTKMGKGGVSNADQPE